MRLQPEAVDVLGVFEPEERVVDRRVEGVMDQPDDPVDWNASATPRMTGKRATPAASK